MTGKDSPYVLDLFVGELDAFNQCRAKAIVFHLIQTGNSTAFGSGYLIYLLFRMGTGVQQQRRGAEGRLCRNELSILGMETYFIAALGCGANIAQKEGNAAGALY